MVELVTDATSAAEGRRAVLALVDDATAAHGRRPLSDEHWLALMAGPVDGVTVIAAHVDGNLAGVAQVVRGNDAHSIEVVVAPGAAEDPRAALLGAALAAVRADGGGEAHYWQSAPGPDDDAVARGAGLDPTRELLQMRRDLPTGVVVGVPTRAFRPGVDDAAWLAVNNRAFAAHPEQGAWTSDDLSRRQAEPWFDPDGFRLHERDGRLAAFCWTKLHPGAGDDPPMGEIYVIAVDPDFQGLGLGRQLTLAGLESIAERGVGVGMLYVDGSNTGAVALYRALGFTVHHTDVAYTTTV
jgi:mycothiol synthase